MATMLQVDNWKDADGHCNACGVDEHGHTAGETPVFSITVGNTMFSLCWEHWFEMMMRVRDLGQ